MGDRVVIITMDNVVGVNGKFKILDCRSLLGKRVRAVQWDGAQGHVEFFNPLGAQGDELRPNEPIKSVEEFRPFIDAWHTVPDPDPPRLLKEETS